MHSLTKYAYAVALVAAVGLKGASQAQAASSTATVGADVSYPQCSGSDAGPLPGSGGTQAAAFAIIGVNNGRPGAPSGCLGAQYSWAEGLGAQAPQLYVNTADPGNTVADWPAGTIAGGPADPYGTCAVLQRHGKRVGADTPACAFEYGVEQAQHDEAFAKSASASTKGWWLDVETGNSWQTHGTIGMNQADLLGMVDTFRQGGGTTVGAYSTHYQWGSIVGSYEKTAGSTLRSLPQWLATGGDSRSAAENDCTDSTALPGFTDGPRTYVQYTATFDYDVTC